MVNRRKGQPESSEIVGSISKLVGSLVGTVVAFGKKIARFRIGGAAALRERIAELESALAAARLELKKMRGLGPKKAPGGQKTKTRQKTGKGKSSDRPQNRPTPKSGVKTNIAVKAQKPMPPAAKHNKKVASTGSAS